MRGEWGVAGTDAETVERIVNQVTGVLEGRGSWMGLISGILSGSLLDPPAESSGQGRISDKRDRSSREDRDGRKRSRRRDYEDEAEGRGERSARSDRRRREDEKGESSRHAERRGQRRKDREDYDDYDSDDYDRRFDEDMKRRRRGREEPRDRGVERAQTWA
jgi:hypothetical protein